MASARTALASTDTAPAESLGDPRFDSDDFFGLQPSSTSSLPNPAPLLENLTRCVIEILAGARDLEQIARWVTDDGHRKTISEETASRYRM